MAFYFSFLFPFSIGRFYHAVELTYYIRVNDGVLNLEFVRIPGQNVARICSVAVRPDPQGRASKGIRYGHNWPGFDYWIPSDPNTLFQVTSQFSFSPRHDLIRLP